MNTAMDDGRPESLGEQTLSFPSISDDDTFDAFTPTGDTKKNPADTPREPRRPRDAQEPRERRPGEAEHVRELRRAVEPQQVQEPQQSREPQQVQGREPRQSREPQQAHEPLPRRRPTSPNRPAFPGHPATGAPEGQGGPSEVNLFGAPAKPAERVDFFTPRKPAADTSPAPEDTPSADRPAPGGPSLFTRPAALNVPPTDDQPSAVDQGVATDPSTDDEASSPEDLSPSEDSDTSPDLPPSEDPAPSTDAVSSGDADVSADPDPSAEPDEPEAEPQDGEEPPPAPSAEAAAPADDPLAENAFRQAEANTLDEGEDDEEGEGAEKDTEEDAEKDAASGEQSPADGTRTEALPPETVKALTTALDQLRESITDLRLGLDLPGVKDARQARTDILAQLDNYVLPRVRTSTAPALIVVAGSTGAGKSTLVNSLAERNVSRTGIRRPTTGTPVLVCHPDDRQWFAEGELLGTVQRLDQPEPTANRGGGAGTGTNDGLVLVSTEKLPQGVALLDTPDIDSVVEEHHEIAHRMLDAADLWIFVTTAARYADAPAWSLLKLAKERGARLAIVLSRVQPKAVDVVQKHFVRMLTEYGLGDIDRFVIHESEVTDGRLPDSEVTDLRLWLAELSVDEERRAQAVRETLNGVLDSFRTRVPALAKHLEAQVAFRAELRKDVEAAFFGALSDIDKAARSGSLLHGEVLARWQDFAGSGDLMRSLQLRRRGRAARQAPERVTAFRAAIRTGLESVIVAAANRATAEVVARWRHRAELGGKLGEGLDHPSDTLVRNAGRAIASWQDHLGELVRTEGVAKRSVSKIVSFDPDSLALIFTVAMFSGANGEGVPHRLVNALLGAESLRGIGAKALSDLRARIGMLFDEEAMRYVQALDSAGVPDESAATRLYQATYNLEVAR